MCKSAYAFESHMSHERVWKSNLESHVMHGTVNVLKAEAGDVKL